MTSVFGLEKLISHFNTSTLEVSRQRKPVQKLRVACYDVVSQCLAQTRTGIGLLEKPPAEKQFLAVESHLGVRASYATRRKRRYEANKCG
jgi:hypothetical protein